MTREEPEIYESYYGAGDMPPQFDFDAESGALEIWLKSILTFST